MSGSSINMIAGRSTGRLAFLSFTALLRWTLAKAWFMQRGESLSLFGVQGCSSIGRALVSKTSGWGFESLRPC
jgi:ribosome biogenesis protein Nip4